MIDNFAVKTDDAQAGPLALRLTKKEDQVKSPGQDPPPLRPNQKNAWGFCPRQFVPYGDLIVVRVELNDLDFQFTSPLVGRPWSTLTLMEQPNGERKVSMEVRSKDTSF